MIEIAIIPLLLLELNIVNASEPEDASRSFCSDSKMGELIVTVCHFHTFAFLRHSLNAMAVRSGPPPAERQMIEPFARVTEPAHQI